MPLIQHTFIASQVEDAVKAAPKGTCFQIFGLDLLLDEDLKAWLLEINDNPSLYIYLEKDYMGGGVEKVLSEVDLQVKKKCLGDAINLTSKIFRGDDMEVEAHKSYSRLHLQGAVTDSLYQLLGLFDFVTSIKNRRHTGLSGLSKLCNRANIKGKVSRTDVTLLFQKHLQESKADEISDYGEFLDFREFCFFVCERLKNFMSQKGTIDVNMSVYEHVRMVCN